MGQYIVDERMREIYQEERDKLGVLPDSDSDFIALDKAWKRYWEEKNSNS